MAGIKEDLQAFKLDLAGWIGVIRAKKGRLFHGEGTKETGGRGCRILNCCGDALLFGANLNNSTDI